ncbi:hypothetical protein Zmor_019335 [Zophobas morio]|uniref:Uncharacterized protein n=1 Tax=Zophobas morio TaxID=2755281 RepID=A0AA38I466_9CUCU|nr:hypothetical protein Zmor_019335 [Zophobas morio]
MVNNLNPAKTHLQTTKSQPPLRQNRHHTAFRIFRKFPQVAVTLSSSARNPSLRRRAFRRLSPRSQRPGFPPCQKSKYGQNRAFPREKFHRNPTTHTMTSHRTAPESA